MRKNRNKILLSVLTVLSVVSITLNTYAHSGRTDSNGGHKDNQNKSGLGSYHYHCGGNPAHLHENGVCPYASSSSSTSNSSNSNNSTSNPTITKPSTVAATGIQIKEKIEEMEIGENQKLTATIEPSNATEKVITWESSNESVATVSETGEVLAIESGVVNITARTSNGMTNTIQIKVNKPEETAVIPTSTNINNTTNTSEQNDPNDANPLSTLLGIGVLSGAYWGYKKYKK